MKKTIPPSIRRCAALAALLGLAMFTSSATAIAQGSDFTYQGFLADNGVPANGKYDLQFTVYDSLGGGVAVGATTSVSAFVISNGLFTVTVSPGEGVFTGAARWLEIAIRPGDSVEDYRSVVPRQPILATPYAVMAGSVAGNGAVGSSQLAETIALGDTNTLGRLDIYRSTAGTPAITLFGNGDLGGGSQISTYGHDGQEQIRLWGGGYGELLLHNSQPANATAVQLTADGANGGFLSLNNTNGNSRALLSGHNTGGFLNLYQADGGMGIKLDADDAGAGLIQVRNTNGNTRVSLDGQSAAAAGEISIYDAGGQETVELLGKGLYPGGILTLRTEDGVTGAVLECGGGGGTLLLYSNDGNLQAGIGGDASGAGVAVFRAADGDETVKISEENGAGELRVDGVNGESRVIIEGNDAGGGGRVTTDRLRANDSVGISRAPLANALEINGNASKSIAGDWLANSDARIKTDIQSVTDALETLSRVRLVNFRYTDTYRAAHPEIANQRYLNVIAQEFREVFPEHVKSSGEKLPDGSEILQVDTYPLTIYSAAAVQELHRELKQKQNAIADLQSRLDRLEQLVTER